MATLKSILAWLEGKKTYFAALALFLIAVYGMWTGVLSDASSLAVLASAFGLVGLADKADRYGALIKEFIENEKKKRTVVVTGSAAGPIPAAPARGMQEPED